MAKKSRTIVCVSDLHCGCQLGLCPPTGIKRDEGSPYTLNKVQKYIWKCWKEFWGKWVPKHVKGEPYEVVINGDTIDNEHHGSKSQISQNKAVQVRIAKKVLKPIAEKCQKLYIIRGSRAHDGTSGEDVEGLAEELGAIPNDVGQYARYELWKYIGTQKYLLHFLHTIGTTSSASYESTAVHKELVESYVESGRWGDRPPDGIIRSHRHRHFRIDLATQNERALSVVTPGWQGKTPFLYKTGFRLAQPQFGGIIIRVADDGELFEQHRVWHLARPKAE